jgi:hypothetical protein
MNRLVIAFAFIAGAVAAPRAMPRFGGPISGIQTSDYGTGSGWIQPMTATYSWDDPSNSLIVKTQAFSCCNTYYQGFYLLYGHQALPSPFPLMTPPFWDGSNLYILPDDAIGFFTGSVATIPIPPDPLLVGVEFHLQCLGQWFTTIGFSTDYGMSQATKLMFF